MSGKVSTSEVKLSKAKIIERDKYRCRLCDSTQYLEVHHLMPKMFGGKDDNNNRITLCRPCHLFMHCNPVLIAKEKELHRARTLAGMNGVANIGKRGLDKKPRIKRGSTVEDKLLALL